MKKTTLRLALLALILVLALAQAACAEPSEALKGVYDALLSADSSYSQIKAVYTEYFPGIQYEETLGDDSFTLTVTGNEDAAGSWTFTQSGDDLTVDLAPEDYYGLGQMSSVVDALCRYLGMNRSVVNGYIIGLNAHDQQSACYGMTSDEKGTHVRMRIAGPWDMPELSEMLLDEKALDFFDPLGADDTSMAANCGKVMMVTNGNVNDATILLGEYGGLDELALKSLTNVVSTLKPKGYEDFLKDYTALGEAKAAGYTVSLNVGIDAAREIIDDASPDYSYALIHFGA